ncbi:four-carbon acid sugar kinase family protein [uncultured Desulfovibrio sp.]|uniref:four-carbon acid sugar kinase family protein n=1 Tax=uncultured Desulfovibrio sp. TaxID=167968 RepID=UPI002625E826|nr:four-carbon acid sugar kinase family protein [uncultured Desulfovibrio sp.]
MIIAVIADDFTGANDNGALLAAKGFSSATCLGLAHWNPKEFTQCDAVCLNAESRLLHREDAYKAVYDAVTEFNKEKPALVSKRIDSTLRGNVGAELEAAIKAMDDTHGHSQTLAVLVASYPHSGRICVGGYQIVHGVPLERSPIAKDAATPVHHTAVLKIIADQTSLPCGFVSLEKVLAGPAAVRETIEAARAQGCRAVVCDAVSDDDIAVIAQSLADAPYPLVSLDPGPFTSELAAARIEAPRAEFENRIFLTVGSTSELTRVQLETLRLAHPCHIVSMNVRKVLAGEAESQAECRRVLEAVFAAPEEAKVLGVCTAASKEDVFSMQEMSQTLGIAPSEISRRINMALAHVAQEALKNENLRIGGLYTSGGEVTVSVMRTLKAGGFSVRIMVLPLAVYGHIIGGEHPDLPMITKGGFVGDKDSLVECMEYLFTKISSRKRPA